MRSVQSELISKNFTSMCILGDSSCEDSKHSIMKIATVPVLTSSSLNFGDGNCGKARPAQHLLLNFTPNDEEDNETSQNKCCAFWDFIKNNSEIKPSKVDTELTRRMKDLCNPTQVFTSSTAPNMDTNVGVQSALSMLSLIQKKGYIDRMFQVKTRKSKCSLGAQDYPHGCERKKKVDKAHDCTCGSDCNLDKKADEEAIYSEMEKFDKEHPKCSPICKNRRRKWKGQILKTSAELLLDKQPLPDCHRKYPQKVHPNSPCPLFGRKRHIKVQPISNQHPQKVIRICQAPIYNNPDTTNLDYVELAKKIGAWKLVNRKKCPFCDCGCCCICNRCVDYEMGDPERAARRSSVIQEFDRRVRREGRGNLRNMYS